MTFTLVIPTHNRPTYLKRNIEYLSQLHFKHRIVIADSSGTNAAESNRKLIERAAKDLEIDYLHMSGIDNYVPKIVSALKRVTTETMMLCGDDDFIVPEQMNRCSDFLLNNEEFSIAGGAILQFRSSKIYRYQHFVWTEYRQREISSNEPSKRVCEFLNSYRPTWYTVHKTKNFLRNFEKSFEKDISRSLIERLICISDFVDGKSKLFDELFLFREAENTLTDEYGNRTWSDAVGKKELISRENQNFSLYKSTVLESMDLHDQNNEVSQIISNDFESWMQRKNLQKQRLTGMHNYMPALYLFLSKLKSKFNSDRYIKTLNENERDYLHRIVNIIDTK